MVFTDIIEKKKNGQKLTKEELDFFIDGYVKGVIPDYQVSALLMAIVLKGMDDEETAALTTAMLNSGPRMDLSGIKGFKVDKHSTGGVGDDTTLLVAPLVAACGCKVAKMSGRGLGFTGGTLDKLESIPGFNVFLDNETFVKNVSKVGLAIMGQTQDLVPADKKLYALRDVTGTVQSLPLIASSIMSKKIAMGTDAVVLDVKTGNGALMPALKDSIKLADIMVRIGKATGLKTTAVVTDMNQPLGNCIGNALSVEEAIHVLRDNIECDIKTISLTLAAKMLILGGICESDSEAMMMLEEKLASGQALVKLAQMIKTQGGDPAVVDDTSILPHAKEQIPVCADSAGYVSEIITRDVGSAASLLGAGRMTKEDVIDPAVGIVIKKRLGDYVEKGEELAIFHVNDKKNFEEAVAKFKKAYTISKDQPDELPLIYTVIED
ncbi:MAG: thymidine phosphorylase [Spirochaetia bacterium]|jgi:pyrimidine-nucleoside phosphorylase|nr:thymidine phosphorylase [Spirochaetia bacterium]